MPRGRRARADLSVDTKPGQVLALALLALAPVAVGFVFAPLFASDGRGVALASVPVVLVATPVFAAWSLLVYWRAPAERRAHRAARIGVVLAVTALALWALVAVLA